eukprot:scaffold27839_cov129-Isochrysis_galbana.AAC.2
MCDVVSLVCKVVVWHVEEKRNSHVWGCPVWGLGSLKLGAARGSGVGEGRARPEILDTLKPS